MANLWQKSNDYLAISFIAQSVGATVPSATAEAFTAAMQAAGNRCDLVGTEGAPHGFFNYGRGDNAAYRATLAATDAFLVSLGWLRAR